MQFYWENSLCCKISFTRTFIYVACINSNEKVFVLIALLIINMVCAFEIKK